MLLKALIAILGGVIAASSLIVSKKPNAKELIDKITPYQGWIGVLLVFWGIWGMLHLILNLGSLGGFWIRAFIMSALEFCVGFLLAYGLISKYVLEKNEEAKEKGQELRAKLIKYQVPGGVVLIILGILSILKIF